ncbi:MAG: ABC transporter ATP-binding protein [Firmicutes bacterium]|nr:ABC transporter ATP-binding protein [Bacillota bacterium]
MIRRLAKCVREYKIFAILSPIMVTAEVILGVLIPMYMADLIDKGVDVGDMAYMRSIGFKLLLLAVASMVFGVLGGIFAATGAAGFASNLRKDMYYNIQRFSFSNVDKFSTAGLVTRITRDITQVQMSFMMMTRMLFRAPTTLVFALVAAFRINGRLPWVFVCTLPILGAGLVLIMKKAFPLFEKVFSLFDRLNTVVQENVRGIRVVKTFVREDEEIKKFAEVADDVKNTSVSAERIVALNNPLMSFCMYTCMLVISWIGARFVIRSEMTTGQLMSMISYVMQILMSLMMSSMLVLMLTMSKAAAGRIIEVLDEQPDIVDPEDPVTEIADGSVEFDDVDFAYGNAKPCLKDATFKIESGQTVGIIGGTGSGKSSLVQLIPRLYDANQGTVYVGGRDVTEYSLMALRKSVSMVLQKNELFEGTVAENMRWGSENATDEEVVEALKLAQAWEFVSALEGGINAPVEQGGSNFSGGQKQRLCIARALISKPKILILDDSTSAVDTATEAAIRRGFKEFMPDCTKIIIAQRISSVKDADVIIVLDNGRINGIGTHEELLASNTIYQEVYESQTKGGDFDEPK